MDQSNYNPMLGYRQVILTVFTVILWFAMTNKGNDAFVFLINNIENYVFFLNQDHFKSFVKNNHV